MTHIRLLTHVLALLLFALTAAPALAQTGSPSDEFPDMKKPAATSSSTDTGVKVRDFSVKAELQPDGGAGRLVSINCKFELEEVGKRRLYGKVTLVFQDKDGKTLATLRCPGTRDKPEGWGTHSSRFATHVRPEVWEKTVKQELKFTAEEPPK